VNAFWTEVLLVAATTVITGLGVWLFYDLTWAFIIVLGILLLFGLHHLRQLSKLICWLEQPPNLPLPSGGGAWEDIFATLHRRSRQAAEERNQLSLALERFLLAGQALPDGVAILDSNHAIEWLNATSEDHLGLSRDKDVGSPITNLVREPNFVRYIDTSQYAEPLILHPVRSPGRSLALQVVPYGEGRSLLLSRDISQVEKLETMRRDFVANVSHELKTPLTVVNGFIETLLDGMPELTEEEMKHFLTLVHEQAQRMQRLIEDLLTLSALETGRPLPAEESVSLAEVLAEVADEARALSGGRHKIELTGVGVDYLLGSRSELRSALGNLVSNAVRYTPEGGAIRVGWARSADGSGAFSVSDNGIGIESQHLPRLTERFYRVDRGRSRESGGTGLGLAIVKHALTRHQAVLEINSEVGVGSTFTARFAPQRIRQ